MSSIKYEAELPERSDEEVQIDFILGELVSIERQINEQGELASETTDLLEKYACDLHDLFLDKSVTFFGDGILSPQLDRMGNVVGTSKIQRYVIGTFYGLDYLTDEESGYITLGVSIHLGTQVFHTPVEKGTINYTAFVPISGSSLLMEPETSLEPEPDDEVASEIDCFLLNESIDLAGLDEYVSAYFSDITDLQREYYQAYINHLLNLSSVKMTSKFFATLDENGNWGKYYQVEEPTVMDGQFTGLVIVGIEIDGQDHCTIAVTIIEEESEVRYLALLEDITDLHLRA